MTDLSASQRVVKILDGGLPRNVEWDAGERVVLGLIEQSADRVELLKSLLDAEMAKPEAAHRVCELAAEIWQAEATIAKMAKSLDPEDGDTRFNDADGNGNAPKPRPLPSRPATLLRRRVGKARPYQRLGSGRRVVTPMRFHALIVSAIAIT